MHKLSVRCNSSISTHSLTMNKPCTVRIHLRPSTLGVTSSEEHSTQSKDDRTKKVPVTVLQTLEINEKTEPNETRQRNLS